MKCVACCRSWTRTSRTSSTGCGSLCSCMQGTGTAESRATITGGRREIVCCPNNSSPMFRIGTNTVLILTLSYIWWNINKTWCCHKLGGWKKWNQTEAVVLKVDHVITCLVLCLVPRQSPALPGVRSLPDDHTERSGETCWLVTHLHHLHSQRDHRKPSQCSLPAIQSRGDDTTPTFLRHSLSL